jgi:hypothetical protein
MAIVKEARPLVIGDEILPWVNTDEEYNEWEKNVESARAELRELPQGSKSITYLMKKSYKDQHSQNSKILYKKTVKKFDFKTGAPGYKDHVLKFNWGMIRTSNYEEIAYLEIHPQWFVREANRELTPMEKMAKKNAELEAELNALKNSGKEEVKPEVIEVQSEVKEDNIKQWVAATTATAPPEIIKPVEKVKKIGSTRKTKTRKKRTNKSTNTK